MTNIRRSTLLEFGTQLRATYPDAVLGFLGNSLGPSAVVDKYLSDMGDMTAQYIIPLSDNCLTLENRPQWPETTDDYVYKVDTRSELGFETYKQALKQSAIAPEKIIADARQLVVLDRVVDARGLASFGYLWTKAAQEQGFDQREIHEALHLCALPNRQQIYKTYAITNDDAPRDVQSGTFDMLDITDARIGELTWADDCYDGRLRLAPRWSLKAGGDMDNTDKCYEKISEIYVQLADNLGDIITVSDGDLLAFQDPAEHRELRRKVNGLILDL